MEIRSYTFDAGLSAGFADLCRRLYAGDRNRLPPAEGALAAPFDPSFSFYQAPGNQHRHFAALRGGEVIGHVSAIVNAGMRDGEGGAVGCLGFFECVEDGAVARALFQHALDWLRRRGGIGRVVGPVNFDIWHGYRLMRRGFDRETFLGEPYNRPDYPGYFESFGFSVIKRWHSTTIVGRATLEGLIAAGEPRRRRLVQEGYRFGPIEVRTREDVRDLHAVLSRSYGRFLAYTPIAYADFERSFRASLRAVDPSFFVLVRDPRGEPAGFSLAYPDPAAALRAMRGRSHLLARLKFVLHRRRARRAVFHSLGVTPEEIDRRHGLGSAIVYCTVRAILDAGHDTLLCALMAEDSPARQFVGDALDRADREYVLYGMTP